MPQVRRRDRALPHRHLARGTPLHARVGAAPLRRVRREIAAFETRLLAELAALAAARASHRAGPAPSEPAKERAINARGEQQVRTTLWRFAGVDLTRIDGISTGVAQVILTEVGPNLSAFPSEDPFVSWLRLCPRTPISGGKPLKKRRNSMGANRIAGVLRMAATTVQRSKTALGASFRRIARHKGAAVAVFATARQLAVLVYRMLRFGHDYVDIGEKAYDAASSPAAWRRSRRTQGPWASRLSRKIPLLRREFQVSRRFRRP